MDRTRTEHWTDQTLLHKYVRIVIIVSSRIQLDRTRTEHWTDQTLLHKCLGIVFIVSERIQLDRTRTDYYELENSARQNKDRILARSDLAAQVRKNCYYHE